MADLQVYQYDSTKLPYESKTYTTPDMGDLYKTPEKNQPGEWSINSNMQMVDLSHPWGNDQPTWPAGEQPYMSTCQNTTDVHSWHGACLNMFPHSMMHRHMSVRKVHLYMKYRWRNLLRLQLYGTFLVNRWN